MLALLIGPAAYFRDAWLGWFTGGADVNVSADATTARLPALTTDRPEDDRLDGGPYADVPERGTDPLQSASPSEPNRDPENAAALTSSARQLLAEGDIVLARAHFSEAMELGLSPRDELAVRTELRKLGRKTIFSDAADDGDPFTTYYVVAVGDTLGKIAKGFDVTPELLARINDIADMNRIQAGRRIKAVRGPFHARITKHTFTLDVYLGGTFVEHFKVGLGAEGATPAGKWKVSSKLKNPTYFSPRGEGIVSADDPKNPLAERWIGLEGVDGDALGQMRYGIHGTIEPESIGKNASMGCIRLHNADVEFLFDLLIENKSTVEVRD